MPTIAKANNTDALHLTSSWDGGVVPTSADLVVWNVNVTASIGNGLSCKAITFNGTGGGISRNGTNKLKVYEAGSPTSDALYFQTGTWTIACDIELQAAGTRIGHNGTTGIITGNISGAYDLYKNGTSEVQLLGQNTFLGPLYIVQGIIAYDTVKDVGGGASSLGSPSNSTEGQIIMTSAFDPELKYIGTSDQSTDRIIYQKGAAGTIHLENSGTSKVTFTTPIQYDNGAKTIELKGTSTQGGVFTSAIADTASGAITINKNGTGTWTLSASNTFTGGLNIGTGGTCIITGSTHSSCAVSVTGILKGTGTVNGAITVNNGGTIGPGLAGTAIGTLATNNVTFNTTSAFSVDLNGSGPTADKINSGGTVALGSAANTLTVASITNSFDGKVYTIISASTLTGTFNGKAEASTFTASGRTLRINYTGTTVTLTDVTLKRVYVCIGEVWKEVTDIQVVQSGAWKTVNSLQLVKSSAWKDV